MKKKIIGIAKRDLKKDETFELPFDVETGELLPNKYINFIHGTKVDEIL